MFYGIQNGRPKCYNDQQVKLSRLRDSGIIFQLNSNLVIVKPDLSRCLKLILCHNLSKMMYTCNCIITCISANNVVFAIIVNCLYSCFFLFPRLEHPAGWICARYKSLLLLLLLKLRTFYLKTTISVYRVFNELNLNAPFTFMLQSKLVIP